VRIKLEGYRCMPAPHALYSKMLAERTASRNVLVLFYLFIYEPPLRALKRGSPRDARAVARWQRSLFVVTHLLVHYSQFNQYREGATRKRSAWRVPREELAWRRAGIRVHEMKRV